MEMRNEGEIENSSRRKTLRGRDLKTKGPERRGSPLLRWGGPREEGQPPAEMGEGPERRGQSPAEMGRAQRGGGSPLLRWGGKQHHRDLTELVVGVPTTARFPAAFEQRMGGPGGSKR